MQFVFVPPQFNVSTTHGAYWWSERTCNTCCTSERSSCKHGAWATCSRVLILCCNCDTNGPTHALTVLSLVSSVALVFACFFAWPLKIVHYCSSCVVVRFILHVLLRALVLSILASDATDPDPANVNESIMNHQ